MGLELTEAEKWQAAQPIRMQDLPDCLPDWWSSTLIGCIYAILSVFTENEVTIGIGLTFNATTKQEKKIRENTAGYEDSRSFKVLIRSNKTCHVNFKEI